MIKLRHIKKSFSSPLLTDINADINRGDVVAIIGPSGCGKSTLLRMINLLEKPDSGEIIIDGEDITAPSYKTLDVCKKVGMVFQNFNLFSHLTVLENVMIPPMDLLGKSKQEAYDRAMELLHMIGMDSRALQYPDVLSGGQKQRVAIARTLAMNPEIILFDEPTSALDPTMVGEVESVIRNLTKEGITMMIVTHEMRFAKEISNRVFYIDEGGIYEEGTPEQIFLNPKKPRTRNFIYQLKSFDTVIDGSSYDFLGAISELEKYGQKVLLDRARIHSLQLVFEELCQQILLGHDSECRIHLTVEYSEVDNAMKLNAEYTGDEFNPKDTDNDVSFAIMKSKTEDMKYEFIEEAEYSNCITMNII